MNELSRKSLRKCGRYLLLFFLVLARLCTRRYDLCYIAPAVSPKGLLKDAPVIMLCKLFRLKTILHMHGKGVEKYSRQYWWYRVLCRAVFKSNRIILLSPLLYADISAYVKPDAIEFCPNGIPMSSEDIGGERAENTIPTVCFLSNLERTKGVLVLLDACQQLKARGWQFHCNFIGKACVSLCQEDFMREVATRDLQEIVRWHGAQYGADKVKLLKQADVFTLPTFYHNECFPLVLLEAMQLRLPIVATPEGAIAEMVVDGKTGFIVPQHDASSLADKIEVLFRDKAGSQRMGEAGYRRFCELYTSEKFENRLLTILLTAINSK